MAAGRTGTPPRSKQRVEGRQPPSQTASRGPSRSPLRTPSRSPSLGPNQSEADGSEKPRVAPGQTLRPRGGEVFDRLHAAHASKIAKLAQLKELAEREEAARAEELSKATVRTSSGAEAFRISGRLYNEAELRRRRRAEREQQHQQEQLDTLQVASQRSTSSRARAEVPRWEKLYASAPLKEKRMDNERRKAQEAEELWMAENCIHRASSAQSAEAFNRLYRDGLNREQRLERMRSEEAEFAAKQLAEGSVHSSSYSAAILEERTRRLYEDGMQRQERLQEAQRAAWESSKVQMSRMPPTGVSRFDLLYSDASRRDEDRKLCQEQHEKEELERYQQRLVTRSTPRTRELSVRKLGDRLEAEEEPELPVAAEALIAVGLGDLYGEPRLRPGQATSGQLSKAFGTELHRPLRSGTPPRSSEAVTRRAASRTKAGGARSLTPPPQRRNASRPLEQTGSRPATPRTSEGCQNASARARAGSRRRDSVQRAVSVDQLQSENPTGIRSSSGAPKLSASQPGSGRPSRAKTPPPARTNATPKAASQRPDRSLGASPRTPRSTSFRSRLMNA